MYEGIQRTIKIKVVIVHLFIYLNLEQISLSFGGLPDPPQTLKLT